MLDIIPTTKTVTSNRIPGTVPRRKFDEQAFLQEAQAKAPQLYAEYMREKAWSDERRRYEQTPEGRASMARADAEVKAFEARYGAEIDAKIDAEVATWRVSNGMNRMTAFSILGIKLNSKPNQRIIKKAFRCKAKKLHPDKGGNAKDFNELNKAYRTLMQ